MVRTIYVVFTNKKHKTVQYAGIVYFKSAEDAKKAAKMLGADIRYLF